MKKLIRLSLLLFKANLNILSYYRTNFYAGIISTLLWVLLAIVSISVITYQTPQIGGWNRFELFGVQGVYSIILGTAYVLFNENIKNLGRLIRRGNLDFPLLKPIDSQYLVSFGYYNLYQLARVFTGMLLLAYSLYVLKVQITVFDLLFFLVFCGASIVVVYSLWFILVTLNFWLEDLFNIHDLIVYTTGLTRYPLEVLRHLSRCLMYVLLPLVVVTTVPAQVLFKKFNIEMAFWSVIMAVLLFVISRKFWKFALKHYTSAGS